MKCPFVKNNYYTCITKSDSDRGMEFLELFRCSDVVDPHKFDTNLQKDDSRVKFINKNGTEVSYFGCIAMERFSDDEATIQKAVNWYLNFYSTQINSTYIELIKQAESMSKRLEEYVRYKKNLENLSKENGFPLFDFSKLNDELKALLDYFEKTKLTPLQEFKLTNQYLDMKSKYKDDIHVWRTTEGVFECTLDTLVETLNAKTLYTGTIHELNVTKL